MPNLNIDKGCGSFPCVQEGGVYYYYYYAKISMNIINYISKDQRSHTIILLSGKFDSFTDNPKRAHFGFSYGANKLLILCIVQVSSEKMNHSHQYTQCYHSKCRPESLFPILDADPRVLKAYYFHRHERFSLIDKR